MFDTDLFRLFCLDRGRDVQECLPRLRAILDGHEQQAHAREDQDGTHVFDLLYREVCVCRDTDRLWPNVDNDHDRAGDELLQ